MKLDTVDDGMRVALRSGQFQLFPKRRTCDAVPEVNIDSHCSCTSLP